MGHNCSRGFHSACLVGIHTFETGRRHGTAEPSNAHGQDHGEL